MSSSRWRGSFGLAGNSVLPHSSVTSVDTVRSAPLPSTWRSVTYTVAPCTG